MGGVSVTRGAFLITVPVPDDVVSMPAEGEWAVWLGITSTQESGRRAIVMVSVTVTGYDPAPTGTAAGKALAAAARDQHPDAALIEEFTTPAGHPAVEIRRVVTQRVGGRDVTSGQAQALVVYSEPRSLGVVSGLCLHPDDLDRAAVLVTGIAAGLTVASAPAAAASQPGEDARSRDAELA